MKFLRNFTIIFLVICCFHEIISAPLEENVKVLTNDYNIEENGNFEFKMLLDNGIGHSAVGTLKEVNGVQVVTVQGEYQFTAPNGQSYTVRYHADENGYVVEQPPKFAVSYALNPRSVATIVG